MSQKKDKIVEELKKTIKEEKVKEELSNDELSDREESENNYSESESSDDSEFVEIDITENELYQVLSAFFETESGDNLCDIIKDLADAVRENTKMMGKLLKKK